MDDGLSEEDAVLAIGSIDEIATQAVGKNDAGSKRRLKIWEIVLLVLGSPIWLSLAIAAFAVILSLYVTLWALIISLWAVFVALIGSALGCTAIGIGTACTDHLLPGIAALGIGVVCAGLSIFMFYGCKAATKGILMITKKVMIRFFGRRSCHE